MKTSWYKRRAYPHFDLPLSEKNAIQYVQEPSTIIKHSFFPFIAFDISQRRFRSIERNNFKSGTEQKLSDKVRPIRVASHKDGYVFAYYANLLNEQYEKSLSSSSYNDCVLAYRKGRGSNITFAKEAFDIVSRTGECSVIAMDIEHFFDSIDHRFLKAQWVKLIKAKTLPDDHFKVFKAITKYSWVERDKCLKSLGYKNEIDVKYPLCSANDFRDKVRKAKLIDTNTDDFGIPQGSQISAVLSNVYMMPFDQEMQKVASQIGGIYRRYCDDILWIVPQCEESNIQNIVKSEISKLGSHISIKSSKTVVSRFDDMGLLESGNPVLQYLGFTFDGKKRLIRSQTLSRFWRKATYSIRSAKKRARRAGNASLPSVVFKRKIYRKFTHLGKRNFLSYVRNSNRKMPGNDISKQMKHHWSRIQKEIKKPLN